MKITENKKGLTELTIFSWSLLFFCIRRQKMPKTT